MSSQPAPTPAPATQLAPAGVAAAVERVHELVRIAATRNGHARATLQLRPVELGMVNVDLRTTAQGLVATIAANDQAGLDALQQAGAELRRTLEDRGVELHRLDLQLAGGGQDGRSAGEARNGAASGASRGAGRSGDDVAAEEDDDLTTPIVAGPAWTSTRSLVDVKA